MTQFTKPVGFRRTQPFGGNPTGIGWALWVGPLVVSRLQPWQGKKLRVQVLRDSGYVGVSALGLCVSVAR
jgi:hypothetical protein